MTACYPTFFNVVFYFKTCGFSGCISNGENVEKLINIPHPPNRHAESVCRRIWRWSWPVQRRDQGHPGVSASLSSPRLRACTSVFSAGPGAAPDDTMPHVTSHLQGPAAGRPVPTTWRLEALTPGSSSFYGLCSLRLKGGRWRCDRVSFRKLKICCYSCYILYLVLRWFCFDSILIFHDGFSIWNTKKVFHSTQYKIFL